MKATNIIGYIVALFLPIIYFTVLTNNSNEKHPVQVFVMCIGLCTLAGLLSSKGLNASSKLGWVLTSIAVGAIEAALLAYAF
jgi:uncharacterized membrane protein YjjB (DUF3815 family)